MLYIKTPKFNIEDKWNPLGSQLIIYAQKSPPKAPKIAIGSLLQDILAEMDYSLNLNSVLG